VLKPADRPLCEIHDLAVLDLDGVVYVGRRAVPGAVRALRQAQEAGMKLGFVTNNAARPPDAVAEHLRSLGVPAEAADVVTSAQAAARVVSELVPRGSTVFLVGGDGLDEALRDRGLRPVTEPEEGVAAVVQGFSPTMPWQRVVDGAMLVAQGLPWVASNTDMSLPTERGLGPGNGTLVDLVARFAHRSPEVAGKPHAALFEETLDRVGGDRPLFVGDRLDTDIAGAVAIGWDSLLVMTGVTRLEELVAAPPEQRPTYLAPDLGGLLAGQPGVAATADEGHRVELGGWTTQVEDGQLSSCGRGSAADWWRAVAVTAWSHLDAAGTVVDTTGVRPPG
jgi:glycerol-1-phosphatase